MIDGGWVPILWIGTAAVILLAVFMRIHAPAFTALQAHSLRGYDAQAVEKVLRPLRKNPGRVARINRVRRLDHVLPVLTAMVLIGWTLHHATLFGVAHIVPQIVFALGLGLPVLAVIFDYVENARLGRMIDALPGKPSAAEVSKASRATVIKLWAYLGAVVIVLVDAAVLAYLRAVIG